ncbi:MAG TPA: hypothetical protein VLX92_29810 [Kofleriaceae bacterium]|nr:hypothetical protein [Kofleriaceae bacterium]
MQRVLVVDADDVTSHAIKRALPADRYRVVLESNAIVAIGRILAGDATGDPFDIVVCAAELAEATGDEVIDIVRRCRAITPIVIVAREHTASSADAELVKPFTAATLRRTVAELLLARPYEPALAASADA